MIKIDRGVFNNNISTLKETSKDDANGEYMTESLLPVINFDLAKNQYFKESKNIQSEGITSNDALFESDGKLTFIEFKNGKIAGDVKYSVWLKVYDSVLLFTDIVESNISYTRENMDYILVYNKEKNPETESRATNASLITKLGGRNFVRFGLERFEKYCFQNVYTYSKEEFEKEFVEKHTTESTSVNGLSELVVLDGAEELSAKWAKFMAYGDDVLKSLEIARNEKYMIFINVR